MTHANLEEACVLSPMNVAPDIQAETVSKIGKAWSEKTVVRRLQE